ncbi:hypothetical protein BDV18DRAFT_141572 [Aspergillus unguis]
MLIKRSGTMISAKPRALPFGFIADVLFQIIINGDASTVLTLCLVNRASYDTVKALEPHICRWFMRLHGIETFNPLITLDTRTGKQSALTVHCLVRSLYRHGLARRLSDHIVPAVWGPFYEDEKADMNFETELKLARRLERGLHVLFHMADISRDAKQEQERYSRQKASLSSKQLSKISKLPDEYPDFPRGKNTTTTTTSSSPSPHDAKSTKRHLTKVLKWDATEFEIGNRRLAFRSNHLDESSEIDFHCTLRMLRELLERMLLRHGPKFWHRDTRNEYSVVSWFLLNQGPRKLAELLLTPQDECCHYETRCVDTTAQSSSVETRECLLSNSLNEYWDAWNETQLAQSGPGSKFAGSSPVSHNTSTTGSPSSTLTNPLTGQHLNTTTLPNSLLNADPTLSPNTTPTCTCSCPRLIRSWSVKPALFDSRGREANRAAEQYLKEMWNQRHVGLHQAFMMGVFAAVL